MAGKKPAARKRLEKTRAKLSEWEAKADKAARDLERYRRPDLVAKAARRGRAAEKKLRELAKQERRLTRTVAKATAKRRAEKKAGPKAAGEYVYHPKVFYARRHHEATVEVSFRWRDGGQRSAEEVTDVLHDLVKGKDRPEVILEAVYYGKLDVETVGRGRDLKSFLGIVLSGNLETIGEEIRK